MLSVWITIRILSNPISNLVQKRLTNASADPLFVIFTTHACLTLALFPVMIYCWPTEIADGFWRNITGAAVLAVAGNTLIVHALKTTDLSVLAPINAYKAVVGMLFGAALLRETPNLWGATGTALVLGGSYFVADDPKAGIGAFARLFRETGVRLRLAALVLAALEAILLKKALLLSSPLLTFLFWSVLGLPVSGLTLLILGAGTIRAQIQVATRQWAGYILLAATTGLMQASTLLTFAALPVGYSLALFQTSTIISVLLGHRYLQEPHVVRRLGGAAIMIAGAVLIVSSGVRGR
jgi:drug/metabolite transporter (DMT)-like permease